MVFDNKTSSGLGWSQANSLWFMQAGCAPVCEYLA
jgi:hypothetical protein